MSSMKKDILIPFLSFPFLSFRQLQQSIKGRCIYLCDKCKWTYFASLRYTLAWRHLNSETIFHQILFSVTDPRDVEASHGRRVGRTPIASTSDKRILSWSNTLEKWSRNTIRITAFGSSKALNHVWDISSRAKTENDPHISSPNWCSLIAFFESSNIHGRKTPVFSRKCLLG